MSAGPWTVQPTSRFNAPWLRACASGGLARSRNALVNPVDRADGFTMNPPTPFVRPLRWTALGLVAWLSVLALPAQDASPLYTQRAPSRDGIGKIYYGREIAHFMSHEGAAWLDRPERDAEEKPELMIKGLGLRAGQIVADIGCGTGYFTWRLAREVGERGVVYGVEIQSEMLQLLDTKMRERGALNVVGVLGTPQMPNLPEAVDVVLMVDVYHELSHPAEMMEAICARLKTGGRLVFVEYRGEDPSVPIKPLHKMTEAQIKKEMADLPLEYVETVHTLPTQHMVVFRRKGRAR